MRSGRYVTVTRPTMDDGGERAELRHGPARMTQIATWRFRLVTVITSSNQKDMCSLQCGA